MSTEEVNERRWSVPLFQPGPLDLVAHAFESPSIAHPLKHSNTKARGASTEDAGSGPITKRPVIPNLKCCGIQHPLRYDQRGNQLGGVMSSGPAAGMRPRSTSFR